MPLFSRKYLTKPTNEALPKTKGHLRNRFKKLSRRLEQIEDARNVPNIPFRKERVPCRVSDVYDGDTCTIIMLVGDKIPFTFKLRITGIDAPEIKSKNPKETQAGIAVKELLQNFIYEHVIYVEVEKWGLYSRLIGNLYLHYDDEDSISTKLIGLGVVKSYSGKTRREKWNDEELNFVIDKCSQIKV